MAKNWWKPWLKIGIILVLAVVLYCIVYSAAKSRLSKYITDPDMGLYSALTKGEFNYEDLLIDTATDYTEKILTASKEERNSFGKGVQQ
ncbi:MAG: hypothetical protein LBM28_03685 [Oscillospiraceae bacterium]|nr:hypothetical protein [Oscillospiraceae bacterium]